MKHNLKTIVFELMAKNKCTIQRVINLMHDRGVTRGDGYLQSIDYYKGEYHRSKKV